MMDTRNWPDSIVWVDDTRKWTEADILFPFAWDEVVCRRMEERPEAVIHVWRHPRAFVMGLRDRRLPHAERAMDWLRGEGYAVAVRNSGGAAVPLDEGVVNVSLALPISAGNRDFRDDFQYMADWIGECLRIWTAEVRPGEVNGAYCPGDYDLSLKGRKFCGISQRRQARGFALQAFVNVSGSGERRGELAARFYEMAAKGGTGGPLGLEVVPQRMGSLDEHSDVPIGVQPFIDRLKQVVRMQGRAFREADPEEFPLDLIGRTAGQLKLRYSG